MYSQWMNVEMEWIDHHNPDLMIMNDDGSEKERIDLSRYNDPEAIEQLLLSKGFVKK